MCKWDKYSLLNSRKWLHLSRSAGQCAVAQVDTHVSHHADKGPWFRWTVKTDHLTHLILAYVLFILGRSLAAGVSSEVQKHQPSETNQACSRIKCRSLVKPAGAVEANTFVKSNRSLVNFHCAVRPTARMLYRSVVQAERVSREACSYSWTILQDALTAANTSSYRLAFPGVVTAGGDEHVEIYCWRRILAGQRYRGGRSRGLTAIKTSR